MALKGRTFAGGEEEGLAIVRKVHVGDFEFAFGEGLGVTAFGIERDAVKLGVAGLFGEKVNSRRIGEADGASRAEASTADPGVVVFVEEGNFVFLS